MTLLTRLMFALAIAWCLIEIYLILARWADEQENCENRADDDFR